MAASQSGDNARARIELGRALALDENYLPSLIALARISLYEGESNEFEQNLDRLIKVAPDAPDVLRLRALASQQQGDADQAIELASTAQSASPTTQGMLELAAYLDRAGRTPEARELQEQWILEHPQDIPARLALASSFRRDQELDKAKTQYEAILQLDPDNLVALNNLAWYLRFEDRDQALTYIRRASLLAPDRAEVLDSLAVIESLNGEHRKARRNIERALEQSPDNPSMLYHRAMIDAALDDKTSAISTLEKLLSDPANDFPEQAEAQALLESLKG
jgi:Tfp pilus assembly protein PilF